MVLEIIRQFNWVDVLMIILVIRVCAVALKSGLCAEIFKLLGTALAIYLAMHYYAIFADWLGERVSATEDKLPLEFLDLLCFTILAVSGYLILALLRSVFTRFVKMEAVDSLNRWGGLFFGLFRAYLLMGLVMFMLVISTVGYLKTSVKKSYSEKFLASVAPGFYSGIWDGWMSKFMSQEKFNKTITEVQEDYQGL